MISSNLRRGISRREVIVIVTVVLIGSLVALIVLNRISEARNLTNCRLRLHAIHQSVHFFSEGHRDHFPDPRTYSAGGSSADLYWLLIHNKYIDPRIVVCPGDANPNVSVFTGPIQSAAQSNASGADEGYMTNPGFRNDLTGANGSWSNVSYAHRFFPPSQCAALEWGRTPLTPKQFDALVLFGDRGPKDGKPDPASYSYQLHGSDDLWVGNLVIGDGSVQIYTQGQAAADPFGFFMRSDPSGAGAVTDNLFTRDHPDDPLDQFIAIFDAKGQPVWD